jgi:mRNA interferase MazF
MVKEFDRWNLEQKKIELNRRKHYHEGEIWWCSFGVNIGDEQEGVGQHFMRPVVILRKFNENLFLGVALVGHKKEGDYFFSAGRIHDREASVVLSQIRTFDSKRLGIKIATMDEVVFKNLKSALRRTLFK